MKVGYARCAAGGTDTQAQLAALERLGARVNHLDYGLAATAGQSSALDAALAVVGEGDELVVPAADRLGRSVRHLHAITQTLAARGARLNVGGVVRDPADLADVLELVVEFESGLGRERAREGSDRARAAGTVRRAAARRKLTDDQEARLVALKQQDWTVAALMREFQVGRGTVYRALTRAAQRDTATS